MAALSKNESIVRAFRRHSTWERHFEIPNQTIRRAISDCLRATNDFSDGTKKRTELREFPNEYVVQL